MLDVLIGCFIVADDFNTLNNFILVPKFYFHKCNLNEVHPTMQVYMANNRLA